MCLEACACMRYSALHGNTWNWRGLTVWAHNFHRHSFLELNWYGALPSVYSSCNLLEFIILNPPSSHKVLHIPMCLTHSEPQLKILPSTMDIGNHGRERNTTNGSLHRAALTKSSCLEDSSTSIQCVSSAWLHTCSSESYKQPLEKKSHTWVPMPIHICTPPAQCTPALVEPNRCPAPDLMCWIPLSLHPNHSSNLKSGVAHHTGHPAASLPHPWRPSLPPAAAEHLSASQSNTTCCCFAKQALPKYMCSQQGLLNAQQVSHAGTQNNMLFIHGMVLPVSAYMMLFGWKEYLLLAAPSFSSLFLLSVSFSSQCPICFGPSSCSSQSKIWNGCLQSLDSSATAGLSPLLQASPFSARTWCTRSSSPSPIVPCLPNPKLWKACRYLRPQFSCVSAQWRGGLQQHHHHFTSCHPIHCMLQMCVAHKLITALPTDQVQQQRSKLRKGCSSTSTATNIYAHLSIWSCCFLLFCSSPCFSLFSLSHSESSTSVYMFQSLAMSAPLSKQEIAMERTK